MGTWTPSSFLSFFLLLEKKWYEERNEIDYLDCPLAVRLVLVGA